MHCSIAVLVLLLAAASSQRISTIQLDGTQYFISMQNPYAPRLNFFLAYQYCRSLGLQLASFETREKADALSLYLKNAKYNDHDLWTSGNKLGTTMMLWMSTGLPFNATFDYMVPPQGLQQPHQHQVPAPTSEEADPALNSARNLDVSALGKSCVALTSPELEWRLHDCGEVKDFVCEQTRCYYYNYGSIPVSAAQGGPLRPAAVPLATTTTPLSAPTIPFTLPTTPYPGLLENSVAPEDDEVAEHELHGVPEPIAEASAGSSEEAALHHAHQQLQEHQEHQVEHQEEHQEQHQEQEEQEEEATMGSEEVLHPTTSPHHPVLQHQPKRLEDLFPFERTRPVVWPKN